MTETILTNDGRKIEYEESFWTGKKIIRINDEKLVPLGKKKFQYQDKQYFLKGNYLTGVTLEGLDEDIVIIRKLNVLEWILVILPLVLVALGGAIGGLLGALAAILIASFVRKTKNVFVKILICLGFTAAATLIWLSFAVLLGIGMIAFN